MTSTTDESNEARYTPDTAPTPIILLALEDAAQDAALIRAMEGLDSARFRLVRATPPDDEQSARADAVIVSVERGEGHRVTHAYEQFPGAAVLAVGPDDSAFAAETIQLGAQDYLVPARLDTQSLERSIHVAITRKHIDTGLREREAHYRILVEEASDGIVVMNRQGHVEDVNRRILEMLGYSKDEMLMLALNDVIPPEELSAVPPRTGEVFAGKTTLRERNIVRKDGTLLPTESTTRMLPDGRVEITVRDITERKEIERVVASLGSRSELILTSAGEGIYGVDLQGLVTFINPAAARMLGWEIEELVGTHIHTLAHHTKVDGSPFPASECPIYEAIRDGAVHHVSGDVFWKKSGTPFFVEYHSNPLREGDKLVGAVVTFTDITSRMEAEAQIRKLNEELEARVERRTAQLLESNRQLEKESLERKRSRDQLEAILLGVADGITAQDTRGNLIYANDAALRVLQFPSAEALINTPPAELLAHFDILDEAGNLFPLENLPGRMATMGLEGIETLVGWRYKATGVVRWSVVKATPILDEGGRTSMVINIFRDITEARQVEQAIRESEKRFRAVFDGSFDAIFILNDDGEIVDCNNGASLLTGLSKDELLTKQYSYFLPEEGQPYVKAAWNKLLEVGDAQSENTIVLPNGTTRNIEYQSKAHILPGFHLAVWHDISSRKKAEQELLQANTSLRDAFKELESFSYSVSHDLQAPLRAISGYTYALQEDYYERLDEEGRNFLDRIIANTGNMDRLINDLLTFSRMSRQHKAEHLVDMDEMARVIFGEVMQINPGRNVRLEQSQLPPALGDDTMIREVISNLIANAVKFTRPVPEAVITITGSSEGAYNLYCVRDNGVGFSMKHHDKLFEVFRRLHAPAEFEGTGVGLALVQRVIYRHGGRVWAEGKVNEGAAFYFTLPAPP